MDLLLRAGERCALLACSHNRKGKDTAPILIAIDAKPTDVIVDGRDFLYTVVQLGNPTASRNALQRLFGSVTAIWQIVIASSSSFGRCPLTIAITVSSSAGSIVPSRWRSALAMRSTSTWATVSLVVPKAAMSWARQPSTSECLGLVQARAVSRPANGLI